MTTPPGKVIRAWLILHNFGVAGPTAAYSVFSPSMPESPDECIAVANTTPVLDGALLETGEVIQHPGIQIKIRSKSHDPGWVKGKQIENAICGIRNELVTVTGLGTFLVQNFHLTSGLMYAGVEEQNKRPWFTLNGTLTIKDV